MNRESIIVPSDDIINIGGGVYYRKLASNEHHALAIKEFSDQYNLGITFESLGLKENDFIGNAWYYRVTALKQVFLRIETTSIVYLPESLSLFQINWLKRYKNFFIKNRGNLALIVLNEKEEVILSKSPNAENKSAVLKLLFKVLKQQEKKLQEESEELKR